MKILADAGLPHLHTLFDQHFALTVYDTPNQIPALLQDNTILLCRSTLPVNAALLAKSSIQCVATASSGIDHIDDHYLMEQGIVLIDAKGCNADAVADYVVSSIAWLQQHHYGTGHKAGIVGFGEVGSKVMPRLRAAGFDVICFDPLKAQNNPHFSSCSLTELTHCDLLCVHANLHDNLPFPSKNLFNYDFLSQLKSEAIIINASRGGIVDEEALLQLANSVTYCTDVYRGEPKIDGRIIDFATLCTPHIAGHSIEAKTAAVIRVAEQLHLRYGLSMPIYTLPLPSHVTLSPQLSWQETVLALYNPADDTHYLKAALDKKSAFLSRRQAHQYRHDFNIYDATKVSLQTQLMLGH